MNHGEYSLLEELKNAKSNKELFDVASAIVTVEKLAGETFDDRSFILHAPLELCARYFLLPLVDEKHFTGARDRIIKLAEKYNAYKNLNDPSYVGLLKKAPFFDISNINVEDWATSLLFASHACILLAMQLNTGETNESINSQLAMMNNEIISDPSAKMQWTNDQQIAHNLDIESIDNILKYYVETIGNIEPQNAESEGIRNSVNIVESRELVKPIVAHQHNSIDATNHDEIEQHFQSLIRTAAMTMLIEDGVHSKFGWSHCLTIPHSIWSLTTFADDPLRMLQAATTHVITPRVMLGKEKMTLEMFEEYFEAEETSIFAEHYIFISDLISSASTMEDAHLVKYIYACFDYMKRDPQYTRLYVTCASRLYTLWSEGTLVL